MSGSHDAVDGGQHNLPSTAYRKDRYGTVFGLLLTSFLTTAALSNPRARLVITTLLYAAALVLALRFAQFPPRAARRLRWGLLAGSVVFAVLVAVLPGRTVQGLALLWIASVLALMVFIIVAGVLRHRVVTMQTVFGALSAYLLIGFLFSALFGATAALTPRPLFANGGQTDGGAIQYFAFITLTTTGYGDLVPAGQPGRSLAVLDALSGQIFLVTLVARLVSVFGIERRRPGADGSRDGY